MHRRIATLALVPLLLIACGDDDDDDVAADATTTTEGDVPSNAGDLTFEDCAVTVDEVSAAVGLPMSEAEVVDSGDGAWCTYAYEDGLTTASVDEYVTTGVQAVEGAGDAWSDLEELGMVLGADEAVWSAENGGLVARAGDRAVRVFVNGPDIELDDPQGSAIVIAEVAFGLATEGE